MGYPTLKVKMDVYSDKLPNGVFSSTRGATSRGIPPSPTPPNTHKQATHTLFIYYVHKTIHFMNRLVLLYIGICSLAHARHASNTQKSARKSKPRFLPIYICQNKNLFFFFFFNFFTCNLFLKVFFFEDISKNVHKNKNIF